MNEKPNCTHLYDGLPKRKTKKKKKKKKKSNFQFLKWIFLLDFLHKFNLIGDIKC